MPSWTSRSTISFVAGFAQPEVDPSSLPAVRLHVVDHPDAQGPAIITRQAAEHLGIAASASRAFTALADGSDCILSVAVTADACNRSPAVTDGQIAVTQVQQYNLHLGAGIQEDFRLFVPPLDEPFELVEMEAEVTLLGSTVDDQEPAQIDARGVLRELLRLHLGLVLAVNELLLLTVGRQRLLLRVTATDTLDADAREEAVAYHCYRGLLTPDTQIYLHSVAEHPKDGQEGDSSGSSPDGQQILPQSMALGRRGVSLLGARARPLSTPSRSNVKVITNDGEWFPVKRKLLRPCIALTGAVRSVEEGMPEVAVDVDCLTFDRVLIFLEALTLGREPPTFGLHLCPALLAAAQHIGLRPLEDYCQEQLGKSVSRLRHYSFEEVKQLNAAGGCWLILDGMVLDVTRWLPEHPGGSKIIPRQSLNLDCSRQFEVYHASRESFTYLREFYQGELLPEDLEAVPQQEVAPSPEFVQQLREFTAWRMKGKEVATHLGSKRAAAKTAQQA